MYRTLLRKGFLVGLTAGLTLNVDKAKCCGIIGYSGKEEAKPFLLEGLEILQNRGYDSVGICTRSSVGISQRQKNVNTFECTKVASRDTSDSLENLKSSVENKHSFHKCGIGHTRWATHGAKTDRNAHPHLDWKRRLALVHNGTITNSDLLRKILQEKATRKLGQAVPFSSETDSEVIAQLIGWELEMGTGKDLPTAVRRTLPLLEGTYGLVIMGARSMVAVSNGSPLCLGIGEKTSYFLASEQVAFARHTRDFVPVRDNELVVIEDGNLSIDSRPLDQNRVQKFHGDSISLTPYPYTHWTLKEIMEQPDALTNSLNFGARLFESKVKLGGLEKNLERLQPIRNLVLAACGTSLHACQFAAQVMRSLACFETVQVFDAAECTRECFPRSFAGFCCVSQSGETKDVQRSLLLAKEVGIPVFSVVNVTGSLIARTTGCGVYTNAGRENGVASTKAFTTQVSCLILVALWFQNKKKVLSSFHKACELTQSLHRLPIDARRVLDKSNTWVEGIASKIVSHDHCFVLGKGLAEPIAMEAALKLKEITYIHAEGYGAGSLKHGPFALIYPNVPIFLIVLDDCHRELMQITIAEVKARGAYTCVITNIQNPDFESDETLILDVNGPLAPLLAVVPFQLLAYKTALLRGLQPDKPRNLAKSVTVD